MSAQNLPLPNRGPYRGETAIYCSERRYVGVNRLQRKKAKVFLDGRDWVFWSLSQAYT